MTVPDSRFVPGDWAGQVDWFDNWDKQMTVVGPTLGFSAAELTRIHDDYLVLQAERDWMVSVEAFNSGLTAHRRIISRGKVGDPTPALPAAPTIVLPVTADPVPPGIWQRNNEDIRRAREAPAYTDETGALLGILPIESEGPSPDNFAPDAKITVEPGYNIKAACAMLGMDALRIDYQRNGTTAWVLAAYLTKVPGEFAITPATPGQPEQGRFRGSYIKDSEQFGQFSPEFPVTLG